MAVKGFGHTNLTIEQGQIFMVSKFSMLRRKKSAFKLAF
jgi:hypothetical protein